MRHFVPVIATLCMILTANAAFAIKPSPYVPPPIKVFPNQCWQPIAMTNGFRGGVTYGCVINGTHYPKYNTQEICARYCTCTKAAWQEVVTYYPWGARIAFGCVVNEELRKDIPDEAACARLNTCRSNDFTLYGF